MFRWQQGCSSFACRITPAGDFFWGEPSLSGYESRGLHYSRDYPGQLDHALDTVLEPWEQASFAR